MKNLIKYIRLKLELKICLLEYLIPQFKNGQYSNSPELMRLAQELFKKIN